MIDENFYKELKKFFRSKGITQQQIGETLGTTQAYANLMLNGKCSLGRQTAQKLHEAYGLSVAWLLTGEGDMLAQPHPQGGTSVNITRGGDVSVSGHHNVNSTAMGADMLERLLEQNQAILAQNAQLIEQTKKQTEIINTLISREK